MLNPNSDSIALSIIIPCFNQGEYILEALASVEACRESIYEVIIVNDGSTQPLTLKVFSYLKEKGYHIIDQPNLGLATARNNAIKKASGQYILALDADNKIRPNYIYKGIEILDRCPEVGVVYGQAELFGEKTGLRNVPPFDADQLMLGNYIDACAVFRKSVWETCGGYDPDMPIQGYEDWDFWLSALENGWKFHYLPEIMFDYRVRSGSMVTLCEIPENRKRLYIYTCTKHLKLYALSFPQILAEKEYSAINVARHAQFVELQLAETRAELEHYRHVAELTTARIQAMETSKFWKLRTAWITVKRRLGLPTE